MEQLQEISPWALTAPNPSNVISVAEFFRGKDVFITGALGFMGKVLVEKLLWECEDIGNLYLLLRVKKGNPVEKRLAEMLKLPVFDRIKARDPKILKKLLPIKGDIIDVDLGISEQDRALLQDTVSVVFHVASSVRFNDPLKKAILLNVRGTRDVINLAKKMKNLKSMVYVSTCYSNTANLVISETISQEDNDWRFMIKTAESLSENLLNIVQAKILKSHPNTYTYSKYLAESVVYEHRKEIPTIIYRPSIVTFAVLEPTPGWIDSMNGPMGIALGVVTGVLHVLYAKGTVVNDYMPCDLAINGLIATSWYRGIIEDKECFAINAASGEKKKISPFQAFDMAATVLDVFMPKRILWYPSFTTTDNRVIYLILVWLTHIVPALILDIVLRAKGIKFRLLTLYRKIFIANDALSYFLSNGWAISTKNFDALPSFLMEDDKRKFSFDISLMDEKACMVQGVIGIKKYILREEISEETMKLGKTKLKRYYWMHTFLKMVVYGSLLYFMIYTLQQMFSVLRARLI